MQVFVHTLSGRTLALNVRLSDSLRRVRELVEEAEGIPARMQRLRLPRRGAAAPGCSLLGDGPCCSLSTLEACGVRPHDTLRLSLRLRGGIDRNNRAGSKPGAGPISSTSANADRRERLRKLAMETVDLSKDPYFMMNHLGTFECKLCLTLHNTEGNYLAHTQAKRHQTNLAKRAARDAQLRGSSAAMPRAAASQKVSLRRKVIRIGRPGYKVVKQRDSETGQRSLLFEISYPEIEEGMQPRHRFMSAYEQVRVPSLMFHGRPRPSARPAARSRSAPLNAPRPSPHTSACAPRPLLATARLPQRVEAPDKRYQFLLFAADPYETVAFKIPNLQIDKEHGKFTTKWDNVARKFTLQLHFKDSAKAAPLVVDEVVGEGATPGAKRARA